MAECTGMPPVFPWQEDLVMVQGCADRQTILLAVSSFGRNGRLLQRPFALGHFFFLGDPQEVETVKDEVEGFLF